MCAYKPIDSNGNYLKKGSADWNDDDHYIIGPDLKAALAPYWVATPEQAAFLAVRNTSTATCSATFAVPVARRR